MLSNVPDIFHHLHVYMNTYIYEGVTKKTHLLIKNGIFTTFRLDTPRHPTFHVMGSKYVKNKNLIIFASFFDHFLTKIYDFKFFFCEYYEEGFISVLILL